MLTAEMKKGFFAPLGELQDCTGIEMDFLPSFEAGYWSGRNDGRCYK